MLVPMSGLAGARPGSGRLGVFPFRFDRVARCLLVPLGVTPATSGVQVTRGRVLIRYGPWRATIDRSDIRAVRAAGPFKAWKAIGPRVSLADRGLTLGTSTRSALCIELRQPIGVLMPRRLLARCTPRGACPVPGCARPSTTSTGGWARLRRATPARQPARWS
jgi:hypothetical protein